MTVCSTCNDTHMMPLGDHMVACTHCPSPCRECRYVGIGAFCERTPCTCTCHAIGTVSVTAPRSLQEIAHEVLLCAEAWEPEARLLGNATADEIARLAEFVLKSEETGIIHDPPDCPGEGRCHGSMVWCPFCGDDAATACDSQSCDLHRPCDECGAVRCENEAH